MLKRLKKLVKLFINYTYKSNPPKSYNQQLIEKSIVKMGNNCDINNLNIYSNLFCENNTNVIIGNDCNLFGQIELQSKNAEVIIGNRVYIGPDTRIFCREKIEIEDDVLISWGCTIFDTNFHSLNFDERKDDVIEGKMGWKYLKWNGVIDKPVKIRKKSWIGFNSIITKGVIIEEGSIIACGSVVSKSTEKYTIVGGNPASLIKHIE